MEQENGCCSQTPAGTPDAGMKLAAVFEDEEAVENQKPQIVRRASSNRSMSGGCRKSAVEIRMAL